MDLSDEWLEADGLGGYATGRIDGVPTRRYHALLVAPKRPPVERFVLVNAVDVVLAVPGEPETRLSRFRFEGQKRVPDDGRVRSFARDPWPTWVLAGGKGRAVRHEIFMTKGDPHVVLSWDVSGDVPDGSELRVRPLLSGRDYHALHRANPAFDFSSQEAGGDVTWTPYDGVPPVRARASGVYRHDPVWYHRFWYEEENLRGFECTEDLASPGEFVYRLGGGPATLVFGVGPSPDCRAAPRKCGPAGRTAEERERRTALGGEAARRADAYVVRRGERGRTIIAGYPWFADWGRDTFIALRGLCISTGRLDDAKGVLLTWSALLSEGMLPNVFPDDGSAPHYNSVDASLWFVVAAVEYLDAAGGTCPAADRDALRKAVLSVVENYSRGTRFRIKARPDGLLSAGLHGSQLTWMDAKYGDYVVTPRVGKPVEVQALWINALSSCAGLDEKWAGAAARATSSFREKFWNERRGCLYDVADDGHQEGKHDARVRPNQIFAVGGLPVRLLDGARARSVVDVVERELWTPSGLRTLSPREPGFRGRYSGDAFSRDTAYHQGTAWPWLVGAFVDAWVYVRSGADEARREAYRRFVLPLANLRESGGVGHLPEIADGDAPFPARGCPFQAWSLGEFIRASAVCGRPVEA